MQSLSNLTHDQRIDFLERYADAQVDKMDRKELEQIVYDSLVENLSYMGPTDLDEYFQSVLSSEEVNKLLSEVV